jgi:hypothetical protein
MFDSARHYGDHDSTGSEAKSAQLHKGRKGGILACCRLVERLIIRGVKASDVSMRDWNGASLCNSMLRLTLLLGKCGMGVPQIDAGTKFGTPLASSLWQVAKEQRYTSLLFC